MKNMLLKKIYKLLNIIDYLFISFFFFFFLRIKYRYLDNVTLKIETWKFEDLIYTHYKVFILILLIWTLISSKNKYYNVLVYKNFGKIKRYINQVLYFSIAVYAISGIKEEPLFSNDITLKFLLSFFCCSFFIRLFALYFYNYLLKSGYATSNVCVIGINKNTETIINTLNSKCVLGNNFKGLIAKDISLKNLYPVFQINSIDLNDFIKKNKIDKIYLSQMSDLGDKMIEQLVIFCQKKHIEFFLIPNSKYGDVTKLEIQYLDTFPILKIRMFPLDLSNSQFMKNILDKIFSFLFCLFFLSWLFPIISFLILIDSRGSVIFKQKRNGLNGKEFDCYKFRTMNTSSTNSIIETKRNDSRVTKIGKFLRKTSLDEIPQFINVLKGEMSVVGPRPHMIVQDIYYKEVIEKYYLRHYVKPGITGLAQVRGYRGAIDSNEDMEKRISADVFYVRNWSIALDIKIILQTFLLMIKGDDNAI
ncbi:putative colanic acid biosysnthesis UDP-glucose lipid carrier transferase [Algoriella xinjiangensis]|uniref:Putative colanic acid biosysnthesis UDP-glucose lipid carrier transferase n=2 Tax=Algoriella xinjiangensis TaxID=684065 RepID=A0A1I4YIG5_9FLAO|nr:exopolysaccharide biosynthesis polyprenyl glycosylphosphotransferase [Algoriella xinjiangensis]SFN37815.1 putative colanic acid biosysnthesis UDP-glucose lipid carrier transferase [Algoriella xinjiangensis]